MLTKKLYLVLAKNNDLGNKLHSHYIYDSGLKEQLRVKKKIESLLEEYNDKKLLSLAYNNDTRKLLRELISLKKEQNWYKIITKILKGMDDLLEREIRRAKAIPQPNAIVRIIKNELKNLPIYHHSDIIKISEVKKGIIKVNYLSTRYSPDYNPNKLTYKNSFEPWRDTQLIFKLNFNKNLFIWDYINVHKSFQGRRLGTRSALFIESKARKIGFRRFSVEYPFRVYWIKKMNYDIPYKYRIGSGKHNYTLEGYKEII